MTTRQQIGEWFDKGLEQKATHMIIVCDTYDWENYPVYVKSTEKVKEIFSNYNNKNMQKVMEVYNLALDKNEQLNDHRVFNF